MSKRNLKGHIRQVMLAGMMTGASSVALANDFSLENDEFTLTGGDGFNETLTIDADGTIGTPSDEVPQSSSFGMPNFSFTLDVTNATDATHQYQVGVVIASTDDNDRRIEAYLGQLTLEVNGSTVTGSIPGGEDLLVYAQGDSLQAEMTLSNDSANGPVTISDGTVSFSGDKLVNRLKDADSTFDRLFQVFDQGGSYSYRIVVEQTSSNTKTTGFFTTASSELLFNWNDDDGSFGDVFEINGNLGDFGSKFDKDFVYSVDGQFTVAATSGGGGGDDDDEDDTPQEPAEEASDVAKNVTEAIRNGASGPEVAQTAIETINNSFNETAEALESGESVNRGAMRQALRDTGDLLGAVAERGGQLDDEQTAGIGAQVKQTVQTAQRLIADDADKDELTDIASSITNILSNSAAAGVELDAEFETQARGVARRAASVQLRRNLGDSLPEGTDLNDPEQMRDLLADNADAQEDVLDILPSVRSSIPSSLGDNVQNPNGSSIGGRTARQALLAALGLNGNDTEELSFGSGTSVQAASHGDPGVEVDDETGVVTITLANEVYTGVLLSNKVAPDEMPEGLTFRRNGTVTLIDNGLALEIAPVAASMNAFNNAVTDAGFSSSSVRGNGSIEIDLGNGERFSGAFAYNNQLEAEGECGAVSIVEPSGAANAAGHAFGVNCENGAEQDVVPFPGSQAFFQAVVASDLTVSADRDTGIITIDGQQRFKPSFFVGPMDADDETYREENAVEGVAFQAVDVNGDGLMDYRVMFENGVQVFYGAP